MKCRLLIYLLLLLMPGRSMAQFIFQNLNENDGLSARETTCLYRDKEGFLWIGTSNGLNRFDGNLIRRYNGQKGEKAYYINAVQPVDDDRNLLVATSRGLMLFDKQAGKFFIDARIAAFANKKILSIKPDGNGRLWLIALKEIFIFDNNKIRRCEEVIPETKILQGQNFAFSAVTAFCWDALRRGFWVGGYRPYFIDVAHKAVYSRANNPLNYPILNKEFITAITLDRDYNLWFGSNTDFSINFWDVKKQAVRSYREIDGKKLSDGFNYLYVDRKNRLWASTWTYSAYLKAPDAPFRKIPYSQDDPNSIAYGHFQDAIEDPEGNIWFATINGLSKNPANAPLNAIYKLPSFDFTLDTGFAHANAIVVDHNQIVAAKEDGIVFYNMDKRDYQRFMVTKSGDLLRNKFLSIAKTSTRWWFGGVNGVYFLDPGATSIQRFEQVKYKSGGTYTNFIFEDIQGKIWFHIVDDALYRYDPESGVLKRFVGKDKTSGLFDYKGLQSYLQLKNGNLLFVLEGTGFLHYDINSGKFSTSPFINKNFFVGQLLEDEEGEIWAAVSRRGLLKYNLAGQCTDSITTANGLLFDLISSIAMDQRKVIWVASSEGLLFFDTKSRDVVRFRINLGKTLQDYWNSVKIVGNKLYAIMLDHIVVIDPSKLASIRVTRPPNITSVKIFEKELAGVQNNKTVRIGSDEDFITFQFASLNHRDVPSLQYGYMMEGIDDDWVNSGRSMIVSYNHLPPGNYTFKVRSTNESGKWMPEINTLKVQVIPQWWQTWWFRFIVVLAVGISLRLTYQGFVARRQKKVFESTIEYFANSVYGENSVNEICWDIARNCISQLHFEDCVVYLFDKEKNKLIQKAAYGPKNLKGHEIENPLELSIGEGIVGAAAATRKPVIVRNTGHDPRYIMDDKKRMSELAVPIMHEGKVIGVVDSENSQPNFFKKSHARALMTIASISATKIAEAQAEDQAYEKEIMLLEINKMLAESQLMALRAQMNPHFVFNCLNSIQECIVTEKYGEASKYLNKFSKLFRTVLNNSDKKLVTIEEERDVLELYLELEQMRFGQTFTYQIIVDEELESEEILLPSMLLQPYVENALWHGLMHKNSGGTLLVSFEKVDDEVFRCTIEDNGIGRKKSFEIKQYNSKAKQHKSKGLQITKDRLDLLQRQGQHASVHIIDKYDDEGQASGTCVVIELSTFLQNV
ncbi:sensor histidine kinase [Dyadobacter sandarakinus]|uniref:Histidine kinase n=1 Tax=Dyadobacter sandarakinus TaxID=2747268 RepID=A0ABX7I1H9_9BACT|nr:histidine kinase [Dyadobacter sandarakinus]QRQ99547.1 histidine kinase [Dyadobacter sandarakinus]